MKFILLLIAVCPLLFAQASGGSNSSPAQTTTSLPNETSTGTRPNRLAVLSNGSAMIATTSNTTGILGIVVSGAGINGNAMIAQTGVHACDFDGSTVAGHYVVASVTSAGACHDSGSGTIYPVGVSVIGQVTQTGGNQVYVLPGAPVGGSTSGGGGSGGASTPSTTLPICGNGVINSTKACTAGTDFLAPGSNVSTLNNDSNFQNATQLANAIAAIPATNLAGTGNGGVTGTLPAANGGAALLPTLTILCNTSGSIAPGVACTNSQMNSIGDADTSARMIMAQNILFATMAGRIVDVQAKYPINPLMGINVPGDQIRNCLDNLQPGYICDARSFVGFNRTNAMNGGALPIRIGDQNNNFKGLWLPNDGYMRLYTNSIIMATPAAPTVTATTGTGNLAPNSYYVRIENCVASCTTGRSAGSTRVGPIALSATGQLNITNLPPCPTYATDIGIYVQTVSGQENLQSAIACTSAGTANTSTTITSQLYNAGSTQLVSETGVPVDGMIIYPGASVYTSNSAQIGFTITMFSGTGIGAAHIATTAGNGYAYLNGINFSVGSTGITGMKGAFNQIGAYFGSTNRNIGASALDNQVAWEITGQLNDVTYEMPNASCYGGSGCTAVYIHDWPANGTNVSASPIDREKINNLSIIGGTLQSFQTGTCDTLLNIQGIGSPGTTIYQRLLTGVNSISVIGTSFEINAGTCQRGIHLTDFSSGSFQGIGLLSRHGLSGNAIQIDSTYNIGTTGFPGTGDFKFSNLRVTNNLNNGNGWTNILVDNPHSLTIPAPISTTNLYDSVWTKEINYGGEQYSGIVNIYDPTTNIASPIVNDANSPITDQANGTATLGAFLLTGTPYASSSAPPLAGYVCPTGTAATWSTAGVFWGINACTGSTSDLVDMHIAGGSSLFKVDYQGNITNAGALTTNAVTMQGRIKISSATSGVFLLQNNSGTGLGGIQLGGTTSSFPKLAITGTNIAVTNADGTTGGSFSTISLGSGSASNTDLTGELSLSSATTASYTFARTFSSHPECQAYPQFDPGSGVRHWITYTSTTSFTVNFSSAVTGTVTYSCNGRN